MMRAHTYNLVVGFHSQEVLAEILCHVHIGGSIPQLFVERSGSLIVSKGM